MYKIETTSFGLHITIEGIVDKAEVNRYIAESKALVVAIEKPFSCIIDVRNLVPPVADVLRRFQQTERFLKNNGLERIAMVVLSPVIKSQASRIGMKSRLHEATLYIDANLHPDWEKIARVWVVDGIALESGAATKPLV